MVPMIYSARRVLAWGLFEVLIERTDVIYEQLSNIDSPSKFILGDD